MINCCLYDYFFLYGSFCLDSVMYDRIIAILTQFWLPFVWQICSNPPVKLKLVYWKQWVLNLFSFFFQFSQSVPLMIKFNPFTFKIVIVSKELLFLLCWLFLTTVCFPISSTHLCVFLLWQLNFHIYMHFSFLFLFWLAYIYICAFVKISTLFIFQRWHK